MFLRGDFDVVDFLIEFPDSDWVLEISVFPELDFSVLSSGNKVLSVLVDVQGIDWSFVSFEAGLADAELVPDFDESVPRNSYIIIGLWDLGNSHLADDIDVLVVSGGGLDLSLSVPDGSQVVES